MADIVTKKNRSELMARVRSKDTGPEIAVRSALHGLGYRFRLHRKDLPGCPDIVLPKYKTAILVHGCFWHQHSGCSKASAPKTNVKFWSEKLRRNIERDEENKLALEKLGWAPIIVWECHLGSVKRAQTIAKEIVAGFNQGIA